MGSLDEYVSKAVGRYSSLFTLPPHRKIVVWLCTLCFFGGVLTVLPLSFSYYGAALGLIFGAVMFFLTLLSDFIIHSLFTRDDPVFNLRRCSALSLFSSLLWFIFTLIGSHVSLLLGNPVVWVKSFLIGFCSALILRLLVFSTASFADRKEVFLSSLLQPLLCALSITLLGSLIDALEQELLLLLLISILTALVAVSFFVYLLNRVGREALGIPSLSLFKAFVANWTENLNPPLEEFFEKLGCKREVRFSLLAFRTGERIKAVMVVPVVHPGPFRNVGSSALPYMIQNALENKLQCVVSVPHGLSGHELDLSSQLQNQRVVEKTLSSTDFSFHHSGATPFVRAQKNGASSSCQIFGNCALLTLTLSPKSMEDLPQELDSPILKEAEKLGLSSAIVIDAHNSIQGPFNLEEAVGSIRRAAITSLERAVGHQHVPFEIGAAKIVPKEFSLKEGMGFGGISLIVTKVGDQKTAYVTIDGNNMISGLREKILLALREVGVDDGEVLTTDTHVVNGIVLTGRGYHPIGEALDQSKLINYIRRATMDAIDNLEPAEVSWRTETIPDVKVIGENQIEMLCLTVEKTANQAKKLAVSIFPLAGIILTALLILL